MLRPVCWRLPQEMEKHRLNPFSSVTIYDMTSGLKRLLITNLYKNVVSKEPVKLHVEQKCRFYIVVVFIFQLIQSLLHIYDSFNW